MATIKSFTSIEQSRKLAEILPFESADMNWTPCDNGKMEYYKAENERIVTAFEKKYHIPCWSLAALIEGLPDGTDIIKDKADTENEKYMCTVGVKDDIISTFGNNPVDACVAMIERLHELKML